MGECEDAATNAAQLLIKFNSFPQLRSSFTKAFTRNAKITKTTRQGSLNGNLSDSKASLPPPTPLKALPKMPTVSTVSSDLGKPPISPTKTHGRHVTLIDNGEELKECCAAFHANFY
jgi:hypothetical protein